jgi:hypothetical protein
MTRIFTNYATHQCELLSLETATVTEVWSLRPRFIASLISLLDDDEKRTMQKALTIQSLMHGKNVVKLLPSSGRTFMISSLNCCLHPARRRRQLCSI